MYTFISNIFQIQTSTLDTFVLYVVATIALGCALFYFWKIIALGIFGIFCISAILSHNDSLEAMAKKPVSSLEMTQAVSQKKEFMEDCLTIAMNSKETCESIYNDKQ